jgi:hypothetical protein
MESRPTSRRRPSPRSESSLVLAKVPGEAGTVVRDVILGVASEAAKRAIQGR